MLLLFCHGLESAPHGRKYHALVEAGIEVEAPDFRGLALAARVDLLLSRLRETKPTPLLVGSSYGGITALCAAILALREGIVVPGLVLCAPAVIRAEPPADELALIAPCPTSVIHGRHDALIPLQPIETFVEQSPLAELTVVDDDHFLAASHGVLVETVRRHLRRLSS